MLQCNFCSATFRKVQCNFRFRVFACGMLRGWGLEGWGLGLADLGPGRALRCPLRSKTRHLAFALLSPLTGCLGEFQGRLTQSTPPYQKTYSIVNVLRVVNLLLHSDVLSRPPCADIISLVLQACLATPLAWHKFQNSQNAQKCLRESAKSDLVSLGRESQRSLSHRPDPVSHRAKHPKTQFHTVQETVLGLSLRRPKTHLLHSS